MDTTSCNHGRESLSSVLRAARVWVDAAPRADRALEPRRFPAGGFDRLVSSEMSEAVGHRPCASFFETCARRLRPDGHGDGGFRGATLGVSRPVFAKLRAALGRPAGPAALSVAA